MRKKSKYKAEKIVVDGIKFDSKDESKFYEYLKELKAKEKILNFELQPKYELQPKFKKHGKTYKPINYVADFLIYCLDGSEHVIDVKGMATPVALQKRKEFDYRYPNLKLIWVVRNLAHGNKDGWINYDELKKIRAKARKDKKKEIKEDSKMNKYEQLTVDLKEAYAEALKAKTNDDGGTANLDKTFLKLKGWREKQVLEAIKNAGLYCRRKTEWVGTGYMIDSGGGQGNDNTRVRNKFLKILEFKGYDVIAFDQMD